MRSATFQDDKTLYQLVGEPMSFDALKRALDALPDQTTGDPCPICEIGEEYVTFMSGAICRPGDEKIIERNVVSHMVMQLDKYLRERNGRIYWRSRVEMNINPHSVILRTDVNGPDVDPITNQRCVMDKNWVGVQLYCRLVRAHMRVLDKQEVVRSAV